MRSAVLLLLICAVCAGEDALEQRMAETARALVVLQRPDGGWGIPFPLGHNPCPTRRVQPRRADEQPLPPVAPEHAERGRVVTLCRAAEALWMARPHLDSAAAAAGKAHSLAARALLAHRGIPPDVVEAVAYLRAEAARGGVAPEGPEAEAVQACRTVLDAAFDRGRRGDLLLGISDHDYDIDLHLTWLSRKLDKRKWHCWLPQGETQPWGRIALRQALLPSLRTEAGVAAQPPSQTFEDGSPFAAAIGHLPGGGEQWMRSLCEAEDLRQPDLLRLCAWAEACIPYYTQPPEVWWRQCLEKWDQVLLRRVQRHASPSGPILLWDIDRAEDANPEGMLWLATLERIREGAARRDFFRTHLCDMLIALAAQQAEDGTWSEGPGGADTTALACLAFLGSGYDHKTPNRHKRTLVGGIKALLAMPVAPNTRMQATRLFAVAEAYSMTNDGLLRKPTQDGVTGLRAAQLPSGGWAGAAVGQLDWPTTAVALMALRSASAGGISEKENSDGAAWWPTQAGDGEGDAPTTLAWKAAAGVFLGPAHRAQSVALTRRLVTALTPSVQLDAEALWAAGLAVYLLGGEEWLAWERRLRTMPLPESPTPGLRAMRVLADQVTLRYAYTP